MKVFLMFREQDFDYNMSLPDLSDDLVQDLDLETLFRAMAKDDDFLYQISKLSVILSSSDIDTIVYRQNILKDCIKNPDIVKNIYDIAVESINLEKKTYFGFFNKYPGGILHSSVKLMELFLDTLKELKDSADKHHEKFESDGFRRFFNMVREELNDEYFAVIKKHLKTLEFNSGILISAQLGEGNKGTNYILRKPNENNKGWMEKLFSMQRGESYSFSISEKDEAGARALSELKDMGINSVANAMFISSNHILNFFRALRAELAFYLGALNLYSSLKELGEPICFPEPYEKGMRKRVFKGLYDVCLSLTLNKKVTGNDLDTKNRNTDLFIITGANQGGKSTFMRSIGISQLMMQCGMFTPAESFSANVVNGMFTHYKRKEDKEMESGKLDEELTRMNNIIDRVSKNSLVLFNESFSSTNEIEGSQIARQIVKALIENKIEVFFVTHMYKLAYDFYEEKSVNAIFLRAQRKADGTRTFKVLENTPLKTSFAIDLYNKIFQKA